VRRARQNPSPIHLQSHIVEFIAEPGFWRLDDERGIQRKMFGECVVASNQIFCREGSKRNDSSVEVS
jgi:hypothetical protein